MVDEHMLFDHTTSNANTTCAAAISATECENASASGGSAIRVVSRVATTSGRRGLTRSADQAARDRPDTPPRRDEAPGGRAAERARGDDRAEHEEGGQREVAAGVREQGDPVPGADRELVPALGEVGHERRGRRASSAAAPAAAPGRPGSRRRRRRRRRTASRSRRPRSARRRRRARRCRRSSAAARAGCWPAAVASVGTVSGTSAVEAGSKKDVAAPYSAAPTASSQTCACPVSSRTASVAWTAPRTRVGRQHHVLPSQPVRPHPAGQHERDPRDRRDRGDDADVGRRPADVQDREDQRDLHHRVADRGGGGAHPHQPVGAARQRPERLGEPRARRCGPAVVVSATDPPL